MGAKYVKATIQTVNHFTGLVMLTETEYLAYGSNEPSFVKLYVGCTKFIKGLQPRTFDILMEILKVVDYENTLNITHGMKLEYCKLLNITVVKDGVEEYVPNIVDRHLGLLVKKGVLTKKARGTYVINPKVIGKGQWKTVKGTMKKLVYGDKPEPKSKLK